MSRTDRDSGEPQAVIHKRILDVAESKPDACLEEIADEVSGASTDLVDRVLAEYGDPSEASENGVHGGPAVEQSARSESDAGSTPDEFGEEGSQSGGSESDTPPGREELSAKQVDALRLVRTRPEATQRDLAEQLDVTAATVSRRLNGIPGFEWERREEIAEAVLDDRETDESADRTETRGANDPPDIEPRANGGQETASEHVTPDAFEALRERTAEIEARIDDLEGQSDVADVDPALAHKVVHACMDAEYVSEEEELELLRTLLE